ncbi:MAG: hypothetical protein K5787_14755 [Lentisphaeria bacterium]|nr:hypothetical protein [Lentisphaeria bacterium]
MVFSSCDVAAVSRRRTATTASRHRFIIDSQKKEHGRGMEVTVDICKFHQTPSYPCRPQPTYYDG